MSDRAGAELTVEVVRGLFPRDVAVGLYMPHDETLASLEARLHPSEMAVLGAKPVPVRRRQFALGRVAAAEALRGLGQEAAPVLRGPGGQPIWPHGVVGAISHTGAIGVAVAGSASRYRGLGIDVERHDRGLSARAARLVCLPSEVSWAESGSTEDQLPPSAEFRRLVLFSAKEALFKAVYPVEGIWLGYGDAELEWVSDQQAFAVTLRKTAAQEFPVGSRLIVRCWLGQSVVLSAIHV